MRITSNACATNQQPAVTMSISDRITVSALAVKLEIQFHCLKAYLCKTILLTKISVLTSLVE